MELKGCDLMEIYKEIQRFILLYVLMKMLRHENKYEVYLKIKFEIPRYVGHGENVFLKLMTT